MNRYFINLSYRGTNYFGWQIQPNQMSVQQKLTEGLSTLLKETIDITGCGRTDTGVHARNYIAHFDTEHLLKNEDCLQLVYKLNKFLPKDIAIHTIMAVKNEGHARFDAISRKYQYTISPQKNPFTLDTAWHLYGNLDVESMNKAAKILLEYTDFSCFSKSNTQVKTNNCKIMVAHWEYVNTDLVFTIKADRFLRNMVRAIVGTMVNIGFNKIHWEEIHQIIQSKNRSEAGTSVPAHGLTLIEVNYPETIYINEI